MRRSSVLLLLPLFAGCAALDITGAGAHADAPIRTSAASYALRWEEPGLATDIGIRFENRSERTMYIVNCNGLLAPVLEKRVDGEWVPYWSPVLPQCLSAPMVIGPGAALERELRIWGALPGRNWGPEWASADVPGTYRIVLHYVVYDYDDGRQGFGETVPLELRVSNELTLTGPA